MTAADDRTLYERWLTDRDGDAFAEIARRHAPVVYDLAVRASGDACLAEDMVQEALLDLALTATSKPVEIGLVAWMARFAICRARNARQSEKSRARRQQVVGERSLELRRREDAMQDTRLERDDELEHALATATPAERIVLAMRYLHGWDYAQIAAGLEISEGAARVRVHRALASVRTKVESSRAAAPATTSDGNGRGDAALLTGLAAMPLYRMPDGLLDLGVEAALRAAAAPPAAAPVGPPRLARLSLQALGLSAALGVGAALTLTVAEDVPVESAALRAAETHTGWPATSAAPRPVDATTAGATWRGVPRPPNWDDGELGRLGRGGGAGSAPRAPDSSGQDDDTVVDPSPAPSPRIGPEEVLRPIPRDTRAATCVPVSSEGERAGTPQGRAVGHAPAAGIATESAAVDGTVDVQGRAPGLPAGIPIVDPARAAHPDAGEARSGVPFRDLSPEQRELVNEAAELVLCIVAADGIDATALVSDRRELRRQSQRVRKEYRIARRRLQRAAVGENAEALAHESARAVRAATAQRAIALLFHVVLADGRLADDLVWPDGADAAAALQDVVDVLGTLLPDGAGADDVAAPPTDSTPLPTDLLPDGATVR